MVHVQGTASRPRIGYQPAMATHPTPHRPVHQRSTTWCATASPATRPLKKGDIDQHRRDRHQETAGSGTPAACSWSVAKPRPRRPSTPFVRSHLRRHVEGHRQVVKPGAHLGRHRPRHPNLCRSRRVHSIVREFCGHGIGAAFSRRSPSAALRPPRHAARLWLKEGMIVHHRAHDQRGQTRDQRRPPRQPAV